MRFRHVLAGPVLAALLVTGCSAAADTAETNTTPLPASDINRRDRATLVTGGELRLAVDQIGSLNPMAPESTAELAELEQAFFPTFFRYDERGVAAPNTDFLESATETSANPTRVTLRLNPRATWADGTRITAADVVATWTACNGKSSGFRCSPELKFNQIESVTQGSGDAEVLLTFAKPYPQWRSIFDRVSVLRAESVQTPDIFNSTWGVLKKEWTSGPFVVPAHDPATKAVVAVPNAQWWGPNKPLLSRITIKEIPRENQLKAYASAEIDVVDLAGSKEFFDAARTVPDHAIRQAGSASYRQLLFNITATSAASEAPVRQAIALALDRSGVGTAALPGITFTAAPQDNRIFLPMQDGYANNAETLKLTRNVNKARGLLNDAGWKEADGRRTREGRTLELRLAQIRGLANSENEARAIVQQLGLLGVRVVVLDVALADFDSGAVLSGGNFDMIVTGVEPGRHPLAGLEDRYGTGAEQNYSRLADGRVDDLVTRIATTADTPQRHGLANELDTILWGVMPTVPLYQQPQTVAVGTRLANYGASGLATTVWQDVGFVLG